MGGTKRRMTIYYTSDTHYNHTNVIRFNDRPFTSVDEMNEAMIKNWNSVVGHHDTVYHLGDFAFDKNPGQYFYRLNGKKNLITGNHDKNATKNLPWDSVNGLLEISDHNLKIVLCHYGMRVWNRSHHGAIHLYGHSHGRLPGSDQSLDVGVDSWDYTPVTMVQILERLKTLPSHIQADHREQGRKQK